jgi:hypothetical protein
VKAAFRERPALRRDEVVLPEALLRDVERHTVAIGRRADELRAAGRHLKRGLLLHGPPGTGKTHTVRWLAGELAGSTTIVLSGGALGVAGPVCRLARELAPSLVVLEDVDLVAEERTMHGAAGYVLFELLNELDGMADDADVAVVLTTNRPDLLEPARWRRGRAGSTWPSRCHCPTRPADGACSSSTRAGSRSSSRARTRWWRAPRE